MTQPPFLRRKGPLVAGIVALTLGLSGFFMGLRQTDHSTTRQLDAWSASDSSAPKPAPITSAPVAPRYAEIPASRLHPNHAWINHLSNHQPAPQLLLATLARTPAGQNQARATRAARRMYDGAPPVSPHPLDQQNPASCLSCHGNPTTIDGRPVPQMSHAPLDNCLQCHVSSVGPTSTWRGKDLPGLFTENAFTGQPPPLTGTRAFDGAPPTIPHRQHMRENCLSCHGPGGTSAFRSTHPERQNCLQCHATDATLDPARAFSVISSATLR